MEEARDLPGLGRVTVRALLTEHCPVLVAEAVAGRAFEHLANLDWPMAGDGRQRTSKRFHTGGGW